MFFSHFCEELFVFIVGPRGKKAHLYFLLYFGPVSVSPHHADSWAVDFQSHNRVHRDTIICPYIVVIRFRQHSVRPIFTKSDKLFCYTVHNVCVLFLFFELWFVDIFFKYFTLWPLQIYKVLYIINIHNIYSDISVVLNMFHPCNLILYYIYFFV